MPGSSFGQAFRITTFGESHGGAVGVVVDGATPGIEISAEEIQVQLDRRKPGQGGVSTPRKEPDTVHMLSGEFEGKTTGTPILLILYNKDADPSAYNDIRGMFRPGHADYTYLRKYGVRDWRGSGRASGRETAARVAAGAIARKHLLQRGIDLYAYTQAAAGVYGEQVVREEIERNALRAADPKAAIEMLERIEQLKEEGDSAGGIVECRITGVPIGLGEPVFDKLDAQLAGAMLSVGAIKGIEFGAGFRVAEMRGSEHNDQMSTEGFLTNNAGGIIGGISSGEEIVFRVAVKPTSSISHEQKTITVEGTPTTIRTEGRHDACICPRIVPVIEAMVCLVLEDQLKRQAAMLA